MPFSNPWRLLKIEFRTKQVSRLVDKQICLFVHYIVTLFVIHNVIHNAIHNSKL